MVGQVYSLGWFNKWLTSSTRNELQKREELYYSQDFTQATAVTKHSPGGRLTGYYSFALAPH